MDCDGVSALIIRIVSCCGAVLHAHPVSLQCRFVRSRNGVCDLLRLRRGRLRSGLSAAPSRGGVEMS